MLWTMRRVILNSSYHYCHHNCWSEDVIKTRPKGVLHRFMKYLLYIKCNPTGFLLYHHFICGFKRWQSSPKGSKLSIYWQYIIISHWVNSRIKSNDRTNRPKIGLFGPVYMIQSMIEKLAKLCDLFLRSTRSEYSLYC